MDKKTLWLLIIASTLTVGNIYYSQPLLGEIADEFKRSPSSVGLIPTLTQIGYVFGLIFVAPLGDVLDKRKLLIWLLLFAGAVMGLSYVIDSFLGFQILAFFIGLTAVQAQIIIPFIAELSEAKERNRNLGLVLSTALLGILIARAFSGFIGSQFGWHAVFLCGAVLMLVLAALVRVSLPADKSVSRIGYVKLIASLWQLFRELKSLRKIALTGSLIYAAFCVFWASLAFYLHSPIHNAGPALAGAFGLIGASGAFASNITSRFVERVGAKKMLAICIGAMIFSYLIMGFGGASIMILIIGVVLLDMGAQAASVSNQTEIYRLYSHARTRLNTIYKVLYFIGGATGTLLSTYFWQHGGWMAVCTVGVVLLTLAGININLSVDKSES